MTLNFNTTIDEPSPPDSHESDAGHSRPAADSSTIQSETTLAVSDLSRLAAQQIAAAKQFGINDPNDDLIGDISQSDFDQCLLASRPMTKRLIRTKKAVQSWQS